jgi:hypothetical protein
VPGVAVILAIQNQPYHDESGCCRIKLSEPFEPVCRFFSVNKPNEKGLGVSDILDDSACSSANAVAIPNKFNAFSCDGFVDLSGFLIISHRLQSAIGYL